MRNLSHRKVAFASVIAAAILLIALMSVASLSAEDLTLSVAEESDDCRIINEFGEVVTVNDAKTKHITTNSTNDNKTYQCEVKDFGNVTGSAITWSFGEVYSGTNPPLPIGCVAGGDFTKVWHETISAGGNLKLTCQFNNNQF